MAGACTAVHAPLISGQMIFQSQLAGQPAPSENRLCSHPSSRPPQLGDSAVWVTCLSACLLTLQELAEDPGPRGL